MKLVRYNPWSVAPFSTDDSIFDFNTDMNTAIDLYETEDKVVVKAQLPGFSKGQIKITIEGANLTIRAESKTEKEDSKDKKYYKKEIREDSIIRSITLPAHVKSEDANAEYKSGILTLSLPKAEEAKPKEISISTED